MLRDSAVSLIAARLGDRDDLEAQIIAEMQLAQTRLEAIEPLPWFLLSEFSSADCVALEERLELPEDFLQEYEHGTLWRLVSGEPPIRLVKGSYERLQAAFPDEGVPESYAVVGAYYRLRPIPDTVYSFRMMYYQKDAVLDSNIENKWLIEAPSLLIAETGIVIADWIQNEAMARKFAAERDIALAVLRTKHEARIHSNMDYYMDPEG